MFGCVWIINQIGNKSKTPKAESIEIENFTPPGNVYRVDKTKYAAMRAALLAVLPSGKPDLTFADAKAALLPLLPDHFFPVGAKADWRLTAVQLDLEAKDYFPR